MQIIYKSKYKEKEKEISSTKGSSQSREREKDTKSSHEKYREKYDEHKKKYRTEDKERIREKHREERSEKEKKYLEYKEHKSKHSHDKHKKHHHKDKDRDDKEKRRDRDKHGHKHDRDLDRERRKAKEKRKEEYSNHSKKLGAQESQGSGAKSEIDKDVGLSLQKKDNNAAEKSEVINSGVVKSENCEKYITDIENIKKESGSESPKYLSKIPIKQEKSSHIQFKEEKEKKMSNANDKTPTRKISTDKDSSSTPTSKHVSNNSNKITVLKELKNIPEIEESLTMKLGIKSEEESEEDSDERWTDKPLKERKSKFSKESRKRPKSPNSKMNKKRRHMDSAKNRRLARNSNYHNGDSSDEGNYTQFGTSNAGDLRQCFGPRCVKPARSQSNYCSDECGINLASHRIVQTLPDRLREWHLTQCVADTRSRKELEKIRAEQDAVKNRLEQLNVDFQNLEVRFKMSAYF